MSDITVEVGGGVTATVEVVGGMTSEVDVALGPTTTVELVGGTPGPVGGPGPPGPQGVPGPPGPEGPGGGSYVHTQAVPSDVWTIIHGLDYSPHFTVFDSSGNQIEGDPVYSSGAVTIFFSAAFGGIAYGS